MRAALRNAKENGYEDKLKQMTIDQQVADLKDCDAEIEPFEWDDVMDALVRVQPLETLNKIQIAGKRHRLLDPVHAIQFALHTDEGLDFLRLWNVGSWSQIATDWPEWLTFKG